MIDKKIKELTTKLTESERDKKSVEATLERAERQAKSQRKQLHQTKDQLSSAKKLITSLKKKLEEAKKAKDQIKQDDYNMGVAETDEALKDEVTKVCKTYCLQVWYKALDRVRVEASSALRRVENVYYPPAICASSPPTSPSSQAEPISKKADEAKDTQTQVLPSSTSPAKDTEQARVTEKEKGISKGVAPEKTNLPPAPKGASKGEEGPHNLEIVLATILIPAKKDPKGKGPASTAAEAIKPTQGIGKENPHPLPEG